MRRKYLSFRHRCAIDATLSCVVAAAGRQGVCNGQYHDECRLRSAVLDPTHLGSPP